MDAAKRTGHPFHMDPAGAGQATEGLFTGRGCLDCDSTQH